MKSHMSKELGEVQSVGPKLFQERWHQLLRSGDGIGSLLFREQQEGPELR